MLWAAAMEKGYNCPLWCGLPRLQPCQISALKIGNDFAGDSAVNVQFSRSWSALSLLVFGFICLLMNPCPSARAG
jgi:hypothetical protein